MKEREKAQPRTGGRGAMLAASILGLGMILVLFVFLWPTGRRESPPAGYVPLRDDALAARYCPLIEGPEAYGAILAVYYRAARDEAGRIHLAYHPAWAREVNREPGWGPFLSRSLYTGGLSLQRAMFGRGDIETVGLTLDPEGRIIELEYERAKDYDPKAFSVSHEKVLEKGPFELPLSFRVMSWNHLFSREGLAQGMTVWAAGDMGPSGAVRVDLAYFSPALWASYGMWKNPETLLRKDRAHFAWERAAAQ